MNPFKIAILFLLIFITGFAQDFKKIENQWCKEFEVLHNFKMEEFEKTEAQNRKIVKLMLQVFKKYPKSMQYPFEKLENGFVSISISENKKLRIFSWDNMLGGTGRENINICQLVDKSQNCAAEINQVSNIDNVYWINSNVQNLYLILSSQKLSNPIHGFFASSLQINAGCKITENVKIFKTATKELSEIGVSYSIFENENEANISYIKDILYIPIVLQNGKLTDRFLKYRLRKGVFYFEK